MSVKGSSPNVRRATKGGSMPNGKLDGFSQRRRTAWFMRDNDPSSFLRRIVFDSVQRRVATPSPIASGSHGKRSAVASIAFSATSLGLAPRWKSGLDITCILLSVQVLVPVLVLLML